MRLIVKRVQDKDVYKDIVRIHENYRKDVTGKVIPEGNVCSIRTGDKKTYAILRGNNHENVKEIAMDEVLRDYLNIKLDEEYDFILSKEGLWGNLMWAWKATEPAYRIAARLSAISVVLGVLGFVLGVFGCIVGALSCFIK